MHPTVKQKEGFSYIEEGEGEIILLLHGLLGTLSNWDHVLNHFSTRYKVIIPLLPTYEVPIKEANLEGLNQFIEDFIQFKKLDSFNLVGNSLGGHLALLYTLAYPQKVKKLILTASSGLYENTMAGSFIKRRNYEYIEGLTRHTFYDPHTIPLVYIDEIYRVLQDTNKAIRILNIARSAQRHNLAKHLSQIQIPTLLIWGLNDTITPPAVAHEFHMLLPNSRLRFIDHCCHAPMMERPERFNELVSQFLNPVPA
jgi:pimeloyl-ACP methyl ester carboxylesterase